MMKKNIGWPLFDKNEKKLVNLAIQKSIHCASEGKNVGFTKKFEIDFAKYHKKKYCWSIPYICHMGKGNGLNFEKKLSYMIISREEKK